LSEADGDLVVVTEVEEAPEVQEAPVATEGAEGAPAAPAVKVKGLGERPKQVPLTYSGPGESGSSGARRSLHGEAQAAHKSGESYPGTPKNAPCPCGSGKKYKLCHGQNE
jgi:preprotein translocase subunit SecA